MARRGLPQHPWHPPQKGPRRVTTGWCLTLILASIMLALGGARRAFTPNTAPTPPHHHLPSIPPTNLVSAMVTHDTTTGAAAMAVPQDEDISIVVSTVDGAVYTMDAWTGQPKSAFYSGPPLYSSSFFPGGTKFQPIAKANQKFFVVPTHEGKIVCVREDGTQEILAHNVLDLLNSPVMICPDYHEECGVLFGEKTTKIFGLDSRSGEVRWVNSRYKLPPGVNQEPSNSNGRNPVLLQRDDYVIRSVNAETGVEEWNVTLADIFAIETFDLRAGREDGKMRYGHGMVQPSVEWIDDRTVQVIHPTSGSVLWRKELPTSPISMYTVHDDRWFAVDFPKAPLGDGADQHLEGDQSSALIPSDRATLLDLSQRKSMRISLPSNRLQPSHLLPPQPLVEDSAAVTERDLATLRQMRQLGLAESSSLSPFFLHARHHQQRYYQRHAQAHGACLNDRCQSFTAHEVIPYTMYDIHKECANGNCGGMLDPGKSKNPLFQDQAGFCPPMGALPPPPFPKSENKILTTGMFMTWETVGTLVVVVFTVAIGTVVLVFRYQDRTNQSAAESARFFAHLIETEEQSRRLSDAVSMIANGGETTINDGSGNNVKSDAVGIGLSRSGTSSADYLDISNSSLSSSWFSQRPSIETRPLTAPPEEPLPPSSLDASQNSNATTFSSFCTSMSKFNGPLALTQACMTREADPSCSTLVAARAILAPAELQRSYSLPSLPPPRVNLSANGNVTVESSRESSRGGVPTTMKDVESAFKGMSEAISSRVDDPPVSFPSFSATATPDPSAAGNNPLMPLVAHSQSQPLTTTTSTALVKSSLSCSPPRMSSAESMATTIETISDASGNPILFLSTSRYKNEFHETNKLGKGGFGTVYKSTNKLDGHEYAIKKIRLSSAEHWRPQLEKVLREVKILALLDHPNIIRYYQAWLERHNESDGGHVNSDVSGSGTFFDDSDPSSLVRRHASHHNYPLRSSGSLFPGGLGSHRWSASSIVEFMHEEDYTGECVGEGPAEDRSRISQWSEEDEEEEEWIGGDSKSGMDDDSEGGGGIVWVRPGEEHTPDPPISTKATPNGVHSTPRGPRRRLSSDSPVTSGGGGSTMASTPQHGHGGTLSSSSLHALSQGPYNPGVSLWRGRRVVPRRAADRRRQHVGKRVLETIYDLCLYIQMQYCSNHTLKDFLESPSRHKHVDKPQALHLFLQVGRGVKYVHERGLIHRDLKPTNCFLVGDGKAVKIGDFGLSRHVGNPGTSTPEGLNKSAPPSPSMNGDMTYVDLDNTAGVGTPVYGSPEQLSGGDYDEKTDVFSLGIMLFEIFHPAFATAMERHIVMRKLHEGKIPDDWSLAHPELVDMVHRMTNRSSARRPSAAEVVTRLEFLQGRPLVLPLEAEQFPRDAVLLRAETLERDGLLQEVIGAIKKEGSGVMKQYAFRSSPDGRAMIEVLLDGSKSAHQSIDKIIMDVRALSGVETVTAVGHTMGRVVYEATL